MQAFRSFQLKFVSLSLALLLFACEQGSETKQQSAPDISENVIINDTEQPPTENQLTEQSTTVDAAIDSSAIFNEFEFSTVEEASIEEENSDNTELYCLGTSSEESSLLDESENIIKSACLRISNRLASVKNKGCLEANLIPSQCNSVQNFPILYTEFPPIPNKTAQGKILVIGGTHGDELTSVSMVFKWIEKLNVHHSGLFHWHLVPLMNPDGLLKPAATRTNANGVDLNRNMPSNDWQQNALKYWREKTNKDVRRYPGEMPSSEPETQWLIDEINSFKPDAIISVHAPYGVVDFDAQVLSSAPKHLGRLLLNLLGTYPGSLGNYAGINRNIPVITLELPHAWDMPSNTETAKLWEDIVAWLRKNINNPVTENKENTTN